MTPDTVIKVRKKTKKAGKADIPHPVPKRDRHPDVKVEGLCATCADRETCMHAKRNKGPITHCEEYNGTGPAVPYTPPVIESDEETRFKGLCVTCEHRETCTLARTKSGIWHCEDYE